MKILKNPKVLVLADQAIFSGTSFLLTILIARTISVSDFGAYSAIILVAYLAISAISAWTTQVFQVASDRSIGYISFVFWAHMLLMTIFVALSKISLLIFSFHTTKTALIFGFGFVMYDFSRKMLLSLDKIASTLILDVLTSLLLLIGFYLFQNLGSTNMSDLLQYFSYAYLISLAFILFRLKPFYFDRKASKLFIINHIKEGKWLFLTAISQWWAGNLFVVASGIYLGAAALGALRLGQSLFGVLNILLHTFENYVLPQSAIKIQQNQTLGIAYIQEMNLKLAYVFIPILLMIIVFAAPIMTLAGGLEYTAYAFVLSWLSILYIFIFLSQPIRFFFRSMQMNSHFFYAYFISLMFALSSSHWMISTYGLKGVIAGLIGSQILLMAYWSFILYLKNINLWKSSTSY